MKCFLTIASFCNFIIGSSITTTQKCEIIKNLKIFNVDNSNQSIMTVISSQKDQVMMNHSDISVALATKHQLMSTLQIKTDVVMNSMYAMSYLLFKHGTYCNRRIN
jgi:hypothetical protein